MLPLTFQEIFNDLRSIDCSSHTEKTPEGFTYLSWAWAVDIIGQKYEWDYTEPELRVLPDGMGYEVSSSVTIGGYTRRMWLPILDNANNSMAAEPWIRKTKTRDINVNKARSFDVNTAKMRCLVKNLAMFGLGLYIYAGEDVPRSETKLITEENYVYLSELITAEKEQQIIEKHHLGSLRELDNDTAEKYIQYFRKKGSTK